MPDSKYSCLSSTGFPSLLMIVLFALGESIVIFCDIIKTHQGILKD